MEIHIKAKNLDLTQSLSTYINEKFGSIAKLLKRFDAEGAAEVWLEIERMSEHHRKGDVFKAEVDIRLPSHMLHAEQEASDVRAAVDLVKDKLHLEIEKYKTKSGVQGGKEELRKLRGK